MDDYVVAKVVTRVRQDTNRLLPEKLVTSVSRKPVRHLLDHGLDLRDHDVRVVHLAWLVNQRCVGDVSVKAALCDCLETTDLNVFVVEHFSHRVNAGCEGVGSIPILELAALDFGLRDDRFCQFHVLGRHCVAPSNG